MHEPDNRRREYEIDAAFSTVRVRNTRGNVWECWVTSYPTQKVAHVPLDMPRSARKALHRWLADRIVVEDAE